MKKIIGILVTRNESDIIESYLRYNLTFLDGILIYEGNRSCDNTRGIIQSLINEGLSAYFIEDIQLNHEIRNVMSHRAIDEYSADLVIPLDTDEFLYHTDGINPRETLEALREDVEYQGIWRTYVYEKEPDITLGFMPNNFTCYRNPEMENPKIYDRHKKAIASNYLIKNKLATFVAGSHFLLYPEKMQNNVKIELHEKLVFAHFPIRSKMQVFKQIIPNWIYKWGVKNRMPRDMFDIFQWGVIFNKIRDNGDLKTNELKKISIEYAMQQDANEKDKIKKFTRQQIDELTHDFGENLVLPGSMNIKFCVNKLNLRYTEYNEDNEAFIRAALTEIDSTVMYLSRESDERAKLLSEANAMINGLTEVLNRRHNFLFPFGEVEKKSSIIIYGGGVVGRQYLEQIKKSNYCHCLFIVDTEYKKLKEIDGVKVCAPEHIKNCKYDKIVISSKYYINEIQKKLNDLYVPNEKIVSKICELGN